jgi:hypothetical protein
MFRTKLAGFATAMLGLAVVIAGLRVAVASGFGVCTASSMPGLPFPGLWCDGSCRGGTVCDTYASSTEDGLSTVWQCGCWTKDGDCFVPIDAPFCVLGRRGDDRYTEFACIRNGCYQPCGEPTTDRLTGGDWSCLCGR